MDSAAASEAWRLMRTLLMSGEGHQQLLRACADAGITPGLLKACLQLSGDQPRAMRDLARTFQCDASYITSIVDALEQQGIAERRPHPSDRRVKTVVLTPHGVELVAKVERMLAEVPQSFEALDDAEQRQLRDLLRKVASADIEGSSARVLAGQQ